MTKPKLFLISCVGFLIFVLLCCIAVLFLFFGPTYLNSLRTEVIKDDIQFEITQNNIGTKIKWINVADKTARSNQYSNFGGTSCKQSNELELNYSSNYPYNLDMNSFGRPDYFNKIIDLISGETIKLDYSIGSENELPFLCDSKEIISESRQNNRNLGSSLEQKAYWYDDVYAEYDPYRNDCGYIEGFDYRPRSCQNPEFAKEYKFDRNYILIYANTSTTPYLEVNLTEEKRIFEYNRDYMDVIDNKFVINLCEISKDYFDRFVEEFKMVPDDCSEADRNGKSMLRVYDMDSGQLDIEIEYSYRRDATAHYTRYQDDLIVIIDGSTVISLSDIFKYTRR